MRKLKAAQKQLDLALANLDRAAQCLEEAGLTPQAHALDGVADPVEELRNTLAAL